jgi:hypothetical protein
MKKNSLLVFVGFINLWTVAVIFAQDTTAPRKGVTVSSPTGVRPVPEELRRMPQTVPDGVTYSRDIPDYQVYQQLILMSQSDGKLGVNCYGKPLSPIFKESANLSGKQYKNLLKIAEETTLGLDELGQKAVPIIREMRAKTPNGRLAPGEMPTVSPELEALNKQKIELIEKAIEKIKTSFGEKDFLRFSEFVDKNFRFGITKATVKIPL